MLQVRARAELQAKKAELDGISSELKLAKRAKDEEKRGELEAARKLAKLERDLLTRRASLRQDEIDTAEADRDLAEASAKAREAESSLAAKREQHEALLSGPNAGSVAVEAGNRELETLERRALDAGIYEAEQHQGFAHREADLAKSRLRLFEAQLRLLAGGGTVR